jgi:hypothetical protein
MIFSNNASALLAASIDDDDVTIQVAAGFGALFPSPTGDQFFYATLEDDDGDIEIVKCTARTGDNLTVERGQDGTTAQAFTLTVTRVELRLVAAGMALFLQKSGGTMTGNIDADGNEIIDAQLTGTGTKVLGGEVAGVPIRGATGLTGNQLSVPANGTSRATAGGAELVVKSDPLSVFQAAGELILAADTRVVVPDIPLRIRNETDADYLEMTCGTVTFAFTFVGLTTCVFNGLTTIEFNADLDMEGNVIRDADFIDYQVSTQAVTATASTTLNWALGSYVRLALGTNITTLAFSNLPASNKFAGFRLQITSSGTRTITWPASVKWPSDVPPNLTSGGVDFVDLWTVDGGTTWYGSFATNMS